MTRSNFFVYSTTATIICGWWLFAFYPISYEIPPLPNPKVRIAIPTPDWNREHLRDALLGDTDQMRTFLNLWEEEKIALNLPDAAALTQSDQECALQLCDTLKKLQPTGINYFPQTFSSASYLLALIHPSQICSLPEGLRLHPDLYPEERCCTISCESNRYRAEKLSLYNPKAAFISNYSDPYTVAMLEQQGIELVSLEGDNTLEAIESGITAVGITIEQEDRAKLLRLFVKAAMHALDNRAQWVLNHRDGSPMIVYYQMMGLQVPANKSLTGYLMDRMHLKVAYNPVGWRLPLSEEKLLAEAPKSLIIISDDFENAHHDLMLSPAILQLDAVKQQRFCYIPNYIQQQSNQFIVLAYLDLVEALRI